MARPSKSEHIQTSMKGIPPREYQVKEIIRCGKDPAYFIKTYVKIPHPVKGLIPFKTFEYQDDCVECFKQNRFVIVNKSRQLGLSTVSAAYSIWMAIFQPQKNILVVATKLEVAKLFIRKVDAMLKSIPNWLIMPKITAHSVRDIKFDNGSSIKAVPTSSDAGRGEAISLLIVDEAAHVEGIDELWLALQPTLSTGGSAILISTPNGVGNLFHSLWTRALKGDNGFKPVELPWTVQPERDQKWYEQQCAELGTERAIQQELLCSFLGSGDTFLSNTTMDLLASTVRDPLYIHPLHEDLWIWEKPEPDSKYVIAADVSSGAGKDYSTFHIINITNDSVIGEFQSNKIPSDHLADLLMKVGQEYNFAMLCPEQNSYGLIVAKSIKDANYPNLFYEKFKNIYSAYMTQQEIRPQDMPGIYTGPKNRDEMLAKLDTVLKNGQLRINSKRILEEFKVFIWKGNRAEAMKNYHDDLVMALAIGVSLFEVSGQTQYSQDEYSRAMLLSFARNNVSLTSNGYGGYGVSQEVKNLDMPMPVFVGNNFAQQQNRVTGAPGLLPTVSKVPATVQTDAFSELRKEMGLPQQQQSRPNQQPYINPNAEWDWVLR